MSCAASTRATLHQSRTAGWREGTSLLLANSASFVCGILNLSANGCRNCTSVNRRNNYLLKTHRTRPIDVHGASIVCFSSKFIALKRPQARVEGSYVCFHAYSCNCLLNDPDFIRKYHFCGVSPETVLILTFKTI